MNLKLLLRGKYLFSLVLLAVLSYTASGKLYTAPVTGYGFGSSYNSILNLSDGTVLVAAGGTNLNWVPAGVPIDTLIIPTNRRSAADTTKFGLVSSAPSSIGYLLHLTNDFRRLIRVTAMPSGLVPDIDNQLDMSGLSSGTYWIRTTRHKPLVLIKQ